MAQPASRSDLINYCKRQLGAPVLEINVADEQIDDLIDDALQYFHERHFDGVVQTYLKYKITEGDINRGRTRGNNQTVGIVTTTASSTIDGSSVTFSFEENSNYLQIPSQVIGINKIFRYDGSQTVTNNMFSVKYQMFLNDIYYFSSTEVLTYAMTKRYLEDMDFALNTEKQIRFNQRQDRLYLDVDWSDVTKDDYLIIDCYRLLDPNDFSRVWNDSFLKRYVTQLIKRQWGQNLMKFQGVKLPGGVELNGRQIYDDAQKELDSIREVMSNTYELPPLDMIG
jgi:hypothetical protein|tara:strand:+ start:3396 stop:4241 length:846 start_codon:yes stop_codon:yes gene_type:complete